MIEGYFRQMGELIANTGIVHSSTISYDKRSAHVGFIRGTVYFVDGSLLHLREFVNMQPDAERYMYVYHYQRRDGTLVFRYDNSPHFPALSTYPHQRHDRSLLQAAPADLPDLKAVLVGIQHLIIGHGIC